MFTWLWCENLKKKRKLGILAQMGETVERNSTAAYGVDSSGSLKVQAWLLKIMLLIFWFHARGKLLTN
jgi:hypothetical protein